MYMNTTINIPCMKLVKFINGSVFSLKDQKTVE